MSKLVKLFSRNAPAPTTNYATSASIPTEAEEKLFTQTQTALLSNFKKKIAKKVVQSSRPILTRYIKKIYKAKRDKVRYPLYIRVCLFVKNLFVKACEKRKVQPQNADRVSSDEEDNDVDGDILEKQLMKVLEREKHAIKNWQKIGLRIQMISSLKLSMRIEDQPIEEDLQTDTTQNQVWWESGVLIIYPESKIGLTWSVTKTIIIFVSLFTLSYSAGFLFNARDDLKHYELFFDTIQLIDIVLTCFTARRSKDISMQTREWFLDENAYTVKAAIKFETQWEVNLKVIIVDYLRADFIYDFLASVPCLITFEEVLWMYPFKILRVIRFIRIIGFTQQLSSLLKQKYMQHQVVIENIFHVFNTILILFFSIHLLACLWIAVGHLEDELRLPWIERFNFHKKSLSDDIKYY